MNTALEQQVLAVALGLADDADAPVTDEVALMRLVAFGDVLRAFAGNAPFQTPSTLRVWLKQCDAAVLVRAIARIDDAAPDPARVREPVRRARGAVADDDGVSPDCLERECGVLQALALRD